MTNKTLTSKTFSAAGLRLVFEEKSEETIVHCAGQITAASSEMLRREVDGNLIPDSRGKLVNVNSRIVLDLSKVIYVDSAGMGAITALWTAGQRRNCDVEIVNLTTRTQKLSNMTGLDRLRTKMNSLLRRDKPFPAQSTGRSSKDETVPATRP